MMPPKGIRLPALHADLATWLAAFTRQVADDTRFRQALAAEPVAALSAAGLDFTADLTIGEAIGSLAVPPGRPALTGIIELDGDPGALPAGAAAELPLDVRLVQYALRPMALVHAPAQLAARLRAAAAGRGLHAVMTPWHFLPVPDQRSNGYVNVVRDARLGTAGEAAWQGVLISADLRYVAAGWLSLYYGWDALLGSVLGYPPCCIAAFPARWRLAVSEYGGEVGDVLLRECPQETPVVLAHPGMNIFARHFGHHLIEQFPCHFGCPETANQAERVMTGLAFFEPVTARTLESVLRAPVFRHHAGETFLFPDGRFRPDGAVTFSQVWVSNPGSAIGRRLQAAGMLAPGGEGWLLRSPAVN